MNNSIRHLAEGRAKLNAIVLALASIGLATLPIHQALANPTGGKVVAGNAVINQESANKIGIVQTSNKAIVDWKSYSIGANEQVQYYQPSASSVTLNRVVGEDPSQILGRLTANGQVFLVNPNGIYFGKNAQIDVAGLVATTHNIRNEDFLAGNYLFNIPGKPGASVINEGAIRIADTGIAAFVAPSVANHGVIVAKLGKIQLAAANGFTLDFNGDQLLTFLVSDEVAKTAFDIEGKQLTSFVENSGRIEAQGGYVLLTAKAAENAIHSVINQSGTIEAQTVGQHKGEILLLGGKNGKVEISGQLDASAPNDGDGGFVETSGADVRIANTTRVSTAAPFGKTGIWLIDPNDYTIGAGGNITGATLSTNLGSTGITINTATLGTPGGNGDIFVNENVSWSANTQLLLQAERNVRINNSITASGSGSDLYVAGNALFVTGNVSAGRVRYLVNDATLTGTTTSISQYVSIEPYSNLTPVRIENAPTPNTLSLTPAEIATLRAPSDSYISIGRAASSSDLTVSSYLSSGNVYSQTSLTLEGRNVTIDAPIYLHSSHSRLLVKASDTLTVNDNVTGLGPGAGSWDAVIYQANNMALNATTRAVAGTATIQTYDPNRSIRIESTPTAGNLSLTPAQFATVHADADRDILLYTDNGNITVTAALASNKINSGYLGMKAVGGSIIIGGQIDGSGLSGMNLVAGQDITFNSPLTTPNLFLNASGQVTQATTAPLTVTSLVAQGGNVWIDNATGGNSISSISADLTGGLFLINRTSTTVATQTDSDGNTINGITAANIGIYSGGNLTLNAPLTATGAGAAPLGGTTTTDTLCAGPCVRPHIELGVDYAFFNNVGAGVFTLPAGKFWSLASDRPETTNLNGLVPNAVSYDAGSINGDVLVSANRVFYTRHNIPSSTPSAEQSLATKQADQVTSMVSTLDKTVNNSENSTERITASARVYKTQVLAFNSNEDDGTLQENGTVVYTNKKHKNNTTENTHANPNNSNSPPKSVLDKISYYDEMDRTVMNNMLDSFPASDRSAYISLIAIIREGEVLRLSMRDDRTLTREQIKDIVTRRSNLTLDIDNLFTKIKRDADLAAKTRAMLNNDNGIVCSAINGKENYIKNMATSFMDGNGFRAAEIAVGTERYYGGSNSAPVPGDIYHLLSIAIGNHNGDLIYDTKQTYEGGLRG